MSAGSHPMPPSESTIFSVGKRNGIFENSQSDVAIAAPAKNSDVMISAGPSLDPEQIQDDDPTCRFNEVSVSTQAWNSGSQ